MSTEARGFFYCMLRGMVFLKFQKFQNIFQSGDHLDKVWELIWLIIGVDSRPKRGRRFPKISRMLQKSTG